LALDSRFRGKGEREIEGYPTDSRPRVAE